MKTFRYDIKFNGYEILGIPFYKQADGRLKDGLLGIVVKELNFLNTNIY